jgi:hypothetical protein
MKPVRQREMVDHCPLFRQAHIWTRQGITLDRSTLAA